MTEEMTGRTEKPIPVKFRYPNAEELAAGVPQDTEMVEADIDSCNKPVLRVQDKHRRLWANQYRAFKANKEQIPDGYLLKEWPVLLPSEIEALQMAGLATVEELAAASASKLKFLGGNALQRKAQQWLEERERSSGSMELLKKIEASELERDAAQAELDDMRKAQKEAAEAMVKMQAQIEALSAAKGETKGAKKKSKKIDSEPTEEAE